MRDLRLQQEEFDVSSKIKALLIELTSSFGLTAVQISQRIRVSAATISRVKNGKEAGGKQLLGALELLYDLKKLERENMESLAFFQQMKAAMMNETSSSPQLPGTVLHPTK